MAVPDLYLCLDQGGHASRAIVFDIHGQLYTQAFCNIDTSRMEDRVEHDPDQIVESLWSVARAAVTQLGSSASHLVAAGLATQIDELVNNGLERLGVGGEDAPCLDERAAEILERELGQDRSRGSTEDDDGGRQLKDGPDVSSLERLPEQDARHAHEEADDSEYVHVSPSTRLAYRNRARAA